MFIGQLLFLKAKKTNRFFSSVMRIQNDRGHAVCETGPYRFVRHPGYLGMIFSWIGFHCSLVPFGVQYQSFWSLSCY
jgi:protein-S-isoprenylcysteine O-methyltransferase Ste14